MKISTILDQIDNGAIALPVFQRGYVWNRGQVRKLMASLYRRHPVGSLLTWDTRTENANRRGNAPLPPGHVKLLLDGQQRITSLYGIIRGEKPPFFEGNPATFTGLHFNMDTEAFEFYAPLRMKQDPCWINITELMQRGIGQFNRQIYRDPALEPQADMYTDRLNRIYTISDIDLYIEDVTGEDKTVDVVVDIFNQVNSGGTKLSKGDLTLAKICASWPEARSEMNSRLDKWEAAGYKFKRDWLLRCVNSLVTGKAFFSALVDVCDHDIQKIQKGLSKAERYIDYLLNLISSRLGLDHGRVLQSVYAFPLMVRYVDKRGGRITDAKERDQLLFWYLHTVLWGRYSGSTETVLNRDLEAIEKIEGGLGRLIGNLRQNRGHLRIEAGDFIGWSIGARFYPLLYMLTRVYHAKDWETGIELSNHMLGHRHSLQIHHIFPKSLLYEAGYNRPQVNALANFTFLTQETNLKVSNRDPAEYIREFVERQPEAMESHWLPMDPELWRIENYTEFLAARQKLLAQAANDFLHSLYEGSVPQVEAIGSLLDRSSDPPGAIASEGEEKILRNVNIWMTDQGLPEGEWAYELSHINTGEVLAILDLAWPNGLQEGYSRPVALLIDEDPKVEEIVNQEGFLFYTNVDLLKRYVRDQILAS